MKYFFTYKTTHIDGKYYVGRHCTSKLNDGYQGSGKWVRSIKDKSTITTEILQKFNIFEELLVAEQTLLDENFGKENCMNFNNKNVGFATGKENPSNNLTEEQIESRSENHWTKSKEARIRFAENNPSNLPGMREIRSNDAKAQWENEEYRTSKSGINHHSHTNEEYRLWFAENNPMNNPESVKKLSKTHKTLYISNDNHPLKRVTAETRAQGVITAGTVKRMIENNPMKNPEIAKQMGQQRRLNYLIKAGFNSVDELINVINLSYFGRGINYISSQLKCSSRLIGELRTGGLI